MFSRYLDVLEIIIKPRLPDAPEGETLFWEDVSSCEDKRPYGPRILRNVSQENYLPLIILTVNNTNACRIVFVFAATYQSDTDNSQLIVDTCNG